MNDCILDHLSQLLMLDYDGVLHSNFPQQSRPPEERQPFCYLPRLETVLRRHPDVGIVITSTHRLGTSLGQLTRKFSPDIRARVLGSTPVLKNNSSGPGSRQREVLAWLKQNRFEDIPWIALDDIAELYQTGACLVVTDEGFRDQEEKDLEAALSNPVAWAQSHPVPAPDTTNKLWVPTR